MKKIFILIGIAAFFATNSFAQSLNNNEQLIYLRTGLSPEILPLQLGYQRGFSIQEESAFLNKIQIGANFTTRPITQSFSDLSFAVVILTNLYKINNWELAFISNPTFKITENNLFKGKAIGTDLGLVGGYYKKNDEGSTKWYIELEVKDVQTWTSYIETSEMYKLYWYDVEDGWYGTPASRIEFNIQWGMNMKNGFGFEFGAGYIKLPEFSIYTTPVTLRLGLNYKIK